MNDVRLWRAPDHTRIVFDLSEPAGHKLIQLGNPDRIVLDMAARVTPRSFALKANEQRGDRLVLDLYDQDQNGSKPTVKKSVANSARRDIIIAIDPGHGGEDPGASGPGGLREKEVVLGIARRLQALFEREPGFKAVLLRTGDYYVSLRKRRQLAHDAQADLLVSIHADAFKSPKAKGTSVYALSQRGASSTFARFLAERENAADLVGGVSLNDKDDLLAQVLYDMSMSHTLDASVGLGSRVLGRMDHISRLHRKQVEQASFAVLKSPDIPSILVETGFISNPEEARLLRTSEYQEKMASAMHGGIMSWFVENPPADTLVAWQKQQLNREYVITRGDTLSEIAQRFNVTVASIRARNDLSSNTIRIGQKLIIPAS